MKLRGCRMSLGSQGILYKLAQLHTILAHDAVQVRQLYQTKIEGHVVVG